jgi:uncharacterized protein YuzE
MEQVILEDLLHTIFLKSPQNLFDEFVSKCQDFYERPAHNLVELRSRKNTKIKGDIFEEFCVLYLKNVKKYDNVWRLQDVPDNILINLGLKRRDMGIDIIAEKDNLYDAVQCKYKKDNKFKTKNVLSWKTLSTFYALCICSGVKNQENKREWNKHIVMTNCDYVRHVGEKTSKDLSICLKSFQKISKDEWLSMCNIEYHKLNGILRISEARDTSGENIIVDIKKEDKILEIEDNKEIEDNINKKLSKEELRKQRILFYETVVKNKSD